MTNEQAAVHDFHRLVGAYSAGRPSVPSTGVRDLRIGLLEEELREYVEASNDLDIVGVADALADLLYVVYGAGEAWGLDLGPIFAEVHRSNMTKVGGPMREDGKNLKPEGWSPPNLGLVIAAQFDELDTPAPYLESRDG